MIPDPPKALQDDAELNAFIDILLREGVTSYLEIGSKFGGSLWRIAHSLPKGSRIVSLDRNINGSSLGECIRKLCLEGYDAHLIAMDSTQPEAVTAALKLGPFDAMFIDGDHRPPGVWNDWNKYAPMARIVAFHDIGWRREPDYTGKRIDVVKVWDEIKQNYRHEEIKLDPTGNNCGIGVLWR